MTPKEKAQDIYNKFALISPLFIFEKRRESTKKQAIEHLKQLIDELELICKSFHGGTFTIGYDPTERLQYYKEVENELQKL